MNEEPTEEQLERFKITLARAPQTTVVAVLCYCWHYKLSLAQTTALFALMSMKGLVSKSDEHTSYFDPQFMEEIFTFYRQMVKSVPPDNINQVLTSALNLEYRLYVDILTRQFDRDIEEGDDE